MNEKEIKDFLTNKIKYTQVAHISSKSGIARESIYRILGNKQGSKLTTIVNLLEAIGYEIKLVKHNNILKDEKTIHKIPFMMKIFCNEIDPKSTYCSSYLRCKWKCNNKKNHTYIASVYQVYLSGGECKVCKKELAAKIRQETKKLRTQLIEKSKE